MPLYICQIHTLVIPINLTITFYPPPHHSYEISPANSAVLLIFPTTVPSRYAFLFNLPPLPYTTGVVKCFIVTKAAMHVPLYYSNLLLTHGLFYQFHFHSPEMSKLLGNHAGADVT